MEGADLLLWWALQEDVGYRDVTTEAVVDAALPGRAVVFGREAFVVSGCYPFQRVFQLVDPTTRTESFFQDGDKIQAGIPVLAVEGNVRSLLIAERTALNILQRLSGIATLTRQMVEAISGTSCRLLDTRKTTPLWRFWEKEAVRHGGGTNHRFSLADGVLIKDNHVAAAGGVGEAVNRARRNAPHTLKIEVEVENLQQMEEALGAGADIVLLDNFSLEMLKRAVTLNRGRALLEASGGVVLETVREIAETGVDYVSCGAVTHSARAIDISMELTL